jgi:hypothetical protein
MSKTVFILGAGASVPCGGPTMANFLDVAREEWAAGRTDRFTGSFQKVFTAIGKMQQVFAKARLDSTNIEAVFTALELAAR